MKVHPAITMLLTWAIALAVFFVLPFQLETRRFTLYGFVVLGAFIAVFCLGALAASPPLKNRKIPFTVALDLTLVDRILLGAAVIACMAQAYDILTGNVLDLESAYLDRNDRSAGVLTGAETGGSLAFQVAFLFYPAGFVAIAREIMLREKLDFLRLGGVGLLPVVLAAIAMGGRGPILYALILIVICANARRTIFPESTRRRQANKDAGIRKVTIYAGFAVVALVAMNYFVQVFITRADVVGGVEAMSDVAALRWGVSFDGPGSGLLRSIIGAGNSYLLYVFIWYGVQGIVMANAIFTEYAAGPTFGIYGLDLGSAIARRINPGFVAEKFGALLDINTYGFLPSAFGSLYVDFSLFAFIPAAIWGYATGLVYRRAKTSGDARWYLAGPFITLGIVFSLINTPLGFGNGLVTHLWLLMAVLVARPIRIAERRLQPA